MCVRAWARARVCDCWCERVRARVCVCARVRSCARLVVALGVRARVLWSRWAGPRLPPDPWAAARRREAVGLGNPPRPSPSAAALSAMGGGVDFAPPLQCTSLWQNSRRLAAPMVVPKKVGFAARAPRARLGNS